MSGGETQGLTVSQVVTQFKDVFEGEGMLMGNLHLQVDHCVPPVQLPARRPPVALKERFKGDVQRRMSFLQGDVRSPVEQEVESVDALSFVSISPQGLARVQQTTEADGEIVLLKTVIQTGWPDTKVPFNGSSTQCPGLFPF